MKKLSFLFGVLFASTVLWANGVEIDGIHYLLHNNWAEVTYTGDQLPMSSHVNDYSGNVVIPDSVTYQELTYPVTEIGYQAFEGSEDLISVVIPNTVTELSAYAFYGCVNLVSCTLGTNVKSIGYACFGECESLLAIQLPQGLETIDDSAFGACFSLTEVTIPSSVTNMSFEAFESCSSLERINVEDGNPILTSKDGVLFTYTQDTLILYPANAPYTSYTIPETVVVIADYAFYGCSNLDSVFITDQVTEIGISSFSYCSRLKYVDLGDGMQNIGSYAFDDCLSIDSIFIPAGVKHLSAYTFMNDTSLCAINVDKNNPYLTSVDGVLYNHAMDTLWLYPPQKPNATFVVPDGITTITNFSIYECAYLDSLILPSSTTYIGKFVLEECDLSAIKVEALVPPTCDDYCFYGLSLAIPIDVPLGKAYYYKRANGWKRFIHYPIYHLYDSVPNSSVLTSWQDTILDVELHRNFKMHGEWNTLCLPFSQNEIYMIWGYCDVVKTFDNAAIVNAGTADEKLEIYLKEVDNVVAGQPYFVIWDDDESETDIDSMIFYDMKVIASPPTPSSAVAGVSFCGIFDPYIVTDTDAILTIDANGSLSWAEAGERIEGFRCFFKTDATLKGMPAYIVDENIPTKMNSNINANINANRKVMIDGKFVIIRDGKVYNAQGAIVD